MGCLKCGKDTGASNVFCDECLTRMTDYPIKTDIPIQLPTRTVVISEKKPVHKKKQPSPAELLKKSRKNVLWLSIAVFLLVISLVISLSYLVHTLNTLDDLQNHGKNYTTVIQ